MSEGDSIGERESIWPNTPSLFTVHQDEYSGNVPIRRGSRGNAHAPQGGAGKTMLGQAGVRAEYRETKRNTTPGKSVQN